MVVKKLDAGQQRELDFVLSQRSSWARLAMPVRVAGALGLALAQGVMVGFLIALAVGSWLLWGSLIAGLMLLVLSVPVLAPVRFARCAVRTQVPTAESMKRGEAAWQRTGQANVPPNKKP